MDHIHMSYIHIQNGFTELFGVVFRYFFLYKRCLHLPNLEDLAEPYRSLIPSVTLTVTSPNMCSSACSLNICSDEEFYPQKQD